MALHIALVVYFFGDELPLRDVPLTYGDFPTHAAQVRRVLQGAEEAGRTWVYDTQLLAGAPNGVLFDADNKGWELWTLAWVKLGARGWWAFNAFILMVHCVMPLVIHAAARLFDLDRVQSLSAMGAAIALWSFDSFTHWMWFVGTISYVFVAYVSVLALALFYRWMKTRSPLFAGLCALVLALGHLVHPYMFFILVVPMVALWIRVGFVEKQLRLHEHFIVVAIAGVTIAANAWWLITALRFFPYIRDSAYFGQAGVELVLFEALGLVSRVDVQGILSPRTSIRLVLAIATVAGLVRWRRKGDRRWLPLAASVITLAAFAYLGAYTPLRQIQPFRHALPLGFVFALVGGATLTDLVRGRPWRGLNGGQRLAGVLLLVVAGVHIARDVLYFFGGSMSHTQTLPSGREIALSTTGHSFAPGYRYARTGDFEALVDLVRARDDGEHRWLVQREETGEGLMARTDAQVLGGFLFRNIGHADANWFRRTSIDPPYDVDAFVDYLQTYAVEWIIVEKRDVHPWWDAHPRYWARDGAAGEHLVYRVLHPTALVDGQGRARAGLNRIAVSGTDSAAAVVIRFHWMETLHCTPDCEIQREAVPGDSVGFMRIPAPHPVDFVIEHRYP